MNTDSSSSGDAGQGQGQKRKATTGEGPEVHLVSVMGLHKKERRPEIKTFRFAKDLQDAQTQQRTIQKQVLIDSKRSLQHLRTQEDVVRELGIINTSVDISAIRFTSQEQYDRAQAGNLAFAVCRLDLGATPVRPEVLALTCDWPEAERLVEETAEAGLCAEATPVTMANFGGSGGSGAGSGTKSSAAKRLLEAQRIHITPLVVQ